MKKRTDPRHRARELVLQKLFEREFVTKDIRKGYGTEFSEDDLKEISEFEDIDLKLYEKLFKGIQKSFSECDKIIQKFAPEWPLSQISRTDLQILRLAIYEGFISSITPVKVAIDEAIELAKEYGGSSSSKFVNGVLGSLLEKYKEDHD